MEPSDDTQPTLLERTKTIRLAYWREEISEAEGLAQIKPFVDEYNRLAAAKAKAMGMRAPKLSAAKFLRTRHDLRWEAHDQHNAARHGS